GARHRCGSDGARPRDRGEHAMKTAALAALLALLVGAAWFLARRAPRELDINAAPTARPAAPKPGALAADLVPSPTASSAAPASRADSLSLPTVEPAQVSEPAGSHGPEQCVLHGCVLDADGHPLRVQEAQVFVTDRIGDRRRTDVDEEGRYSFAGLVPGEWTLGFAAVGYRD